MKLINKNKLLEELKKLKQNLSASPIVVIEDVESLVESLEVEEINNVWNNASDFPKAEAGRSILVIEDNGRTELLKSPSAERLFHFRIANLKMWAYVDELLSITTHFDVKEVDLDAEFDKYCETLYLIDLENEPYAELFECAKHFFELGLKVQKGE